MGRSVDYLDNAQEVAYFDVSSMGSELGYKFECSS